MKSIYNAVKFIPLVSGRMGKNKNNIIWALVFSLWGMGQAVAQNDNCADAIEIGPIGYTLGTWTTTESAYLNGATTQTGEVFSNALYPPNNTRDKRAKSVWFKFSIPTARGVKIELDQTDPLITPAEVGFEVFQVSSFPGCLPTLSELSVFSIIDNLGSSVNACVKPGNYLIHVVSTNHSSTNNPFFVKITTGLPSNPPTPAQPVITLYDIKSNANNMGTVSGTGMGFVVYELGCHTVDDANETCSDLGSDYLDYTQSSWHVFTTDAFVDAVRVEFNRPNTGGCTQATSVDVGYKLWVGNVISNPTLTNNPANLFNSECAKIVVDGTDDWKDYVCLLAPNTTYTIQLLFKKNYSRCIGVRVHEIGAGNTVAPLPTPVHSSHVVNPLPASAGGTLTSRDDVWACNARMSVNPCPTVKPSGGYVSGNYNLNDWIVFYNSQITNIQFESFTDGSCNSIYNRLYSGNINTDGCNLTLYQDFYTSEFSHHTIQCLPVGWYSLQLTGQLRTGSQLFTCHNDLAKNIRIRLRAFSVPQYNTFSLRNPVASHIGNFNSGNPLNGDTDRFQNQTAAPDYTAVQDQFGCGATALPADYTDCSGHTSINKAMYRIFVIPAGKTGFIRAWNLKTWDFRYRLYSGNASTLVGAGINIPPSPDPTTFTGLTPVTSCDWNGSTVCVGPGTYTLVTFGDADDVGDTDQPTIEFDWINTEYDRDLSHSPAVDVLNSGNPLVSGTTYTADLDVFDCDQSVMPPNVCNNTPAFDRAIYRQFVINDYGTLDIIGTCGTMYRVYSGNALTSGVSGNTLTGLSAHSECFAGVKPDFYYCFNYCGYRCNTQGPTGCKYDRICVTPGTYTLVAFGNGNMVGKLDQPDITFTARHNKFSLTNTPNPAPPNPANNRVDLINSGNPLVVGTTYNAVYNEFDCYPTVLPHPASSACKPDASYPAMDRAMYRVLQVNASGILTISGLGLCPQSCGWHPGFGYRFYKGNAQALAAAQNVNTAGQTITGLVDLIGCDCNRNTVKVCVEPGYYTLVTFGFDEMRGYGDQPSFRLDQPTTLFANPSAPNNMGTINATTSGTTDTWTCITNAVTVGSGANARQPCNVGSPAAQATKAIYRIFTLSQPRHLTISVTNGVARLFTGHSTSGLSGLVPYSDCTGEWACFTSRTTSVCCLMPAGNYTLVIYGYGPDYNTGPPQYTSGSGQQLGENTNVSITIHTPPTPPQYYAPNIASNQGVTDYWPGHGTGTAAYPETRREYVFNTEWFDCSTQSTANIAGPCLSPSGINRTVYYRFQITNESYIRIRDIPSSMGVQIYKQDPYAAPSPNFPVANRIHDCIRRFDYYWCFYSGTWIGEIEICRLEPGVYTMILFATNAHIYTSVTPRMIVEQVRTSKFDFASQAYDFGVVPGYGHPLNNTEIFQKVGEATWFTGRPNSNDFFTCKTGAFRRDPGIYDDGLWQTPDYSDGLANNEQGTYRNFVPTTNPNPTVPYPMPQNYVVYEKYSGVDTTTVPIRRNLWYTFVLQGEGTCYVSVYPKTASQTRHYPFNVFASDVDGTLDFAAVVAGGHVDSTIAQGLTRVAYSSDNWCGNFQTVSFTRTGCTNLPTRYYVVVDHNAYIELNNQIEVGVRFHGLPTAVVKYDHFKEFATGHDGPNVINGLGQTAAPYTSVVLNNGTYTGAQASFNCATKHPTDQNTCGTTTLWYKIEISTQGRIRLNFDVTNGTNTYTNVFDYGWPLYLDGNSNMQLYRALTSDPPNYDAGSSVLQRVPLTPIIEYDFVNYQHKYWGEACITPGTYYIMMTGCSFTGAWSVTPRVQLIHDPVLFDFFPNAGTIGSGVLGVGTYTGPWDTYSCATADNNPGDDPDDPNPFSSCDYYGTGRQKTLWYTFETSVSGKVRVNYDLQTDYGNFDNQYDDCQVELYRQTGTGLAGLSNVPMTQVSVGGHPWGEACVSPGRYYIFFTGTSRTRERVRPRISFTQFDGDFCTNAIPMSIHHVGSANATATVDCHTIGTDYGENGAGGMGCLLGVGEDMDDFKSSWYRINFTGTPGTKYDLQLSITENSTALLGEIRFRDLYGACGAITLGKTCTPNGMTIPTVTCILPGTYFVQVVSPVSTKGTITVNATTLVSANQSCAAVDPTLPVADFSFNATCVGVPVTFNNASTWGPDIVYSWDFTPAGSPSTSTATNPSTTYATAGTYAVTLTVTNTVTSASASVTKHVTVYPVPGATITRGAPYDGPNVPGGIGIDFFSNATNTIPGTTYSWNFGSGATPPTSTDANPTGVVFNTLGLQTVTLYVINGTCSTMVQQSFTVIAEDIYKGGPNDGAAMSDEGIEAEIVGNPGEICRGQSVQLNASVTSGTVSSWLWTPATGLSATNIPNPVASPIVTTTYTVRAVMVGGCLPKETQVTVFVKPFGIVADAGPDYTMCGLETVQLGTPAQSGGTYSWAPATGLSNPNIAEPIFTPTATGTYNFTLTVYTTGFECPTTDPVTVTVVSNPGINLGPDKYLCPAQMSATISVSPPVNSRVQWQPDKLANLNYTLDFNYRPIVLSDYTSRYTASTEITGGAEAYHADLNYLNGWKPTVNNTSQWVSFDMGRDTILVRITTAGKPSFFTCCPFTNYPDSWVTSYQVDYSRNGTTWTTYTENGNPRTFTGNTNATGNVTHTFNEPIFARYIRIRPLTWSSNGIGLRFRVDGHFSLGSRFPFESPVTSQNVKAGTFMVHAFVPGCSNRLSDTITVHPAMPIPTHYRTHHDGNWANDTTWQVLNEVNYTWVHVPSLDPCYNVHWPDYTKKTILVRDSVDYDCPTGTMIDECTISPTGVIRIPANKNFELHNGAGAGMATMPPSFSYVSPGVDLDNYGKLIITGFFTLKTPQALLRNQDNSIVHYNGSQAPQLMWNGSYANLWVDGPNPPVDNLDPARNIPFSLNNAHIKQMTGHDTVRQELRFINSKIALGAFNLRLTANAFITGPSQSKGYIIATDNGYLDWHYNTGTNRERFFPLGGVWYSPAWIKFDQVTTAGSLWGRLREQIHPNDPYAIKRFWTFSNNNGVADPPMMPAPVAFTGDYEAKLNYRMADLPSLPNTPAEEFAMVEVGEVYNPIYTEPMNWRRSMPIANAVTVTHNLSIDMATIINNAFSDFTLRPADAPLPVEALALQGAWDGPEAVLQWRTVGENKLLGYELERSFDNAVFRPITFVYAKGDGTYEHRDSETKDISATTLFYRVRAIDFDGQSAYSNTVELTRDISVEEEALAALYPNPAKSGGVLVIKYNAPRGGTLSVSLYDLAGKLLYQKPEPLDAGLNTLELPLSGLAKGTYMLKLDSGVKTYGRRIAIVE